MKHIKKFESRWDDEKKEAEKKRKHNVDILGDLLDRNPLSEDHDFYIFIGRDEFKKAEGGMYKKTLEIENMVEITPDQNSLFASAGLELRARFQGGAVYHIWLPKDMAEFVSGKGSNSMEDWVVDLIDKYKRTGGDDQGRQIYKDVVKKRKIIDDAIDSGEKYNI